MRFRHGGKVATVITVLSPLLSLSLALRKGARGERMKKGSRQGFLPFFGKIRGVLQIIVWKFRGRRNEWDARGN